jgi:hypothetical protein
VQQPTSQQIKLLRWWPCSPQAFLNCELDRFMWILHRLVDGSRKSLENMARICLSPPRVCLSPPSTAIHDRLSYCLCFTFDSAGLRLPTSR